MAGSGIYGTFGMGSEGNWGAAEADDGAYPLTTWITFDKEDFEYKKGVIQSKALHGGPFNLASRRAFVKQEAAGTVDLQVYDAGMQPLCLNMAGAMIQSASVGGAGYKTRFLPYDGTNTSLRLQLGRPMTNNQVRAPFTYRGAKVIDWSVSLKGADLAAFTASFDAKAEETVATTGYEAPSYVSSNQFVAAQAKLCFGGTPGSLVTVGDTGWDGEGSGVTNVTAHGFTQSTAEWAAVNQSFTWTPLPTDATQVNLAKDFSIKVTNVVDTDRFYIGYMTKAEQIINGYRDIEGALTIAFNDLTTVYDNFASDTPIGLLIDFEDANALSSATPSGSKFKIWVPVIQFNADKLSIQGTEIIDEAITWSGFDDEINNPFEIEIESIDNSATFYNTA